MYSSEVYAISIPDQLTASILVSKYSHLHKNNQYRLVNTAGINQSITEAQV
jgi:hypothetical protein